MLFFAATAAAAAAAGSICQTVCSELGNCNTREASLPLPPNTKPVSRQPHRANPRTEAVIIQCGEDMLADGSDSMVLPGGGERKQIEEAFRFWPKVKKVVVCANPLVGHNFERA